MKREVPEIDFSPFVAPNVAARMMERSITVVDYLCKTGRLRFVRDLNGHRLVLKEDVLREAAKRRARVK